MQIMYVDESGDAGREPTSSPVFVLAGLIAPAAKWAELNEAVIEMRKSLASDQRYPMRQELRGSDIMKDQKASPTRRIDLLLAASSKIAALPHVKLMATVVKKKKMPVSTDVFRAGWAHHLTRFEDYLSRLDKGRRHAHTPGMILCDDTHGKNLNKLVASLRRERKVKVRGMFGGERTENKPLTHLIENPQRLDSRDSFLVQAADICAYALYQRYNPHAVILKAEKKDAMLKTLEPIMAKTPGVDEFGVFEV